MSDPAIYTVAWICAVGAELVAAQQFLDETHDNADQLSANDDNTYILGKVSRHNIVVAALPLGQYGLVSAALVARDMVRSFPNLRFALMVGIGGGAPSKNHDIRLGDIVVSSPSSGTGGVYQYDFGKAIQDGSFKVTGHLNQSPQCLLRAIPFLEADYESNGNGIDAKIIHILENKPRLRTKYGKPDSSTDRLFRSGYKHADENQECTAACIDTELILRSNRPEEDGPKIHFGVIASANSLIKDAKIRDRLSSEKDVLCFEMEAAGLMNHFPCIVIRGICDYSDTHKNKAWQGYAAMAAAAYVQDLLGKLAPQKVERERKLIEVISHVNDTNTHLRSLQESQHVRDMTRWLTAPDVSSNLNKSLQARHPGSGQRLIEGKFYRQWKSQPNSFLWLYGKLGCGKTILVSSVIEDLQRNQTQNPLESLLYFYFESTDSRKNSFENTLRSLISQIYVQNENAREHLDLLYSSYRERKEQPDFTSLQKTFTEMMRNLEEVWIVLDALDECKLRSGLLPWISSIIQDSSAHTNVHLLVTSRPEQDIRSAFQVWAGDEQMIAMRDDLLQADIRQYVRARVREHEGLSRWHGYTDIQDKIESSLLEKADGMFRWVSCQLDVLEDCLERKALLKALQSLPKTLDETYERILAGLPSAHVHHTIRILQFLTYSERPLRLDEAVDVIAVDVGDVARERRFDPKDRLPVPEEITRLCSSLVVLVKEEIQLAHLSVKEYLTSNSLKGQFAQYLEESAARTSIAEVCLSYLLVPDPTKYKYYRENDIFRIGEDDLAEFIGKTYPFARYAAEQWVDNAVQGNSNVYRLLKVLCLDEIQFSLCGSLCAPEDFSGGPNWMAPPIYYASLYGMLWWVQMLVDEGPDVAEVNVQGGEYDFALNAATIHGYTEIVKLLLEKGADANVEVQPNGRVLIAAILQGERKIVQLLLENGADINVNVEGYLYCGPFNAAVWKNSKSMVQLLLDSGAAIDTHSTDYEIALQTAKERGYAEILQLLLDRQKDRRASKERSRRVRRKKHHTFRTR